MLYVDFGNKEWVDNERVRQIEMDFLYLPFQAVECRLPLCANNASGKIWSEMAKYAHFFLQSYVNMFMYVYVNKDFLLERKVSLSADQGWES